jgi:hypothetical protein
MSKIEFVDYTIELNGEKAGEVRLRGEHVNELIVSGKYCLIPVVDILKNGEYGVASFEIVKLKI